MGNDQWFNIGITGGNMLSRQIESAQQYNRQKKLMGIQNQNQLNMMAVQQQHQMELDKYGQQLQMETWEQTNYPAQVAMLQKAGLNPGLLYSKGGAGGTTGSQSGGSAASGSAASGNAAMANPVNLMEIRTMQSMMELQKANARKANAEAKVIEEYGGGQATAGITATEAQAGKSAAEAELAKVNARIREIEEANTQSQIDYNLKQTAAMTNKMVTENEITKAQAESLIKRAAAEAIGASLENELTQAKTKLTETEKQAITTKIVQEWTKLGLEGRSLDQKDKEIAIHKFTQEIAAEYPSAMNVMGSVLKKAYKTLEWLSSMGTGGISAVPIDKIK